MSSEDCEANGYGHDYGHIFTSHLALIAYFVFLHELGTERELSK